MIEAISPIDSKTDYIMVRKSLSMRYIISKPQTNAQNGTILLLQGYGKQVEDYQSTIHKLAMRGFFTICPDLIGQGKSDKLRGDKWGAHVKDYRKFIDDLDILFHKIILQNLPAPYYILGDDMGAIIALTAHDLFATKIRRQILISPPLTPGNHYNNSFFHRFSRIISDIGLGRIRTRSPIVSTKGLPTTTDCEDIGARMRKDKRIYPSLGWYSTMLDAISYIASSDYIDNMAIPTLVFQPNQDNFSSSPRNREFASRLRMAKLIDLRGAPHDILASEDQFTRQFWQGFSAFIPGSSFMPNFKQKNEWHNSIDTNNLIDTSNTMLQITA